MSRARRILRVLLWAALLAPLAEIVYPGCALLTNGPNETVQVRAAQPHARVYLNDRLLGEAPLTAHLPPLAFHRLRVELDGFEPADIPLHLEANGMAATGDILLGGAPLVIDLVTGAIFEKMPPTKFIDRNALFAPDTVPQFLLGQTDLHIFVTLKPAERMLKIGQLRRTKKNPGN